MIISGASGSGKTQKVMKILKYKDIILDTTTKKVIFFYSEWQDSYEALKELKLVDKFIRGISPQEELMAILSDTGIQHYTSKPHQLLIFDDLVSEIQDDLMSKLFTVYGHHRNVSIILVTQALFNPRVNKFNILQENVHYLLLSKSPRDNSKLFTWQSKFHPTTLIGLCKLFKMQQNYPIPIFSFRLSTHVQKNYVYVQTYFQMKCL